MSLKQIFSNKIIYSYLSLIIVSIFVWFDKDFLGLQYFWIVPVILLFFDRGLLTSTFKHLKNKKTYLILIISFIPVIITVISYQSTRFHGDDLLTAYFSTHSSYSGISFFRPVPFNQGDWVCQFPSIYFVIQKGILSVLGSSLLSVKLSVLPYQFLTGLFIFLLSRRIFKSTLLGLVAVVLYSFTSISLYLTTVGLHFISSTCLFSIFLYFSNKQLEKPTVSNSLKLGLLSALGLLLYISSYLIPVFLFILYLIIFTTKRSFRATFLNGFVSISIFLLTLSPFFIYMARSDNFYLTQRYNQVKLIDGDWSGEKDLRTFENIFTVYKRSSEVSFKSLYKDGIGGHGGYDFGHLALLDWFSIFLIILSPVIFFINKNKSFFLFMYITIIITYITGMVITIPPPAFHRISLVFPGLAIIMTNVFYFIFRKINKKTIRLSMILLLLIIFSFINYHRYVLSVKNESMNPDIEIIDYLSSNLPNRHLIVAAFPSLGFEKVCYFYDNCSSTKIETLFHSDVLDNYTYSDEEKYVFLVIFYSDFEVAFKEKFPDYTVVKFLNNRAIMYN